MKPTEQEIESAGEIAYSKARVDGIITNNSEAVSFYTGWVYASEWAISQMQPEWVAVSDRMPNDGDTIIVTDGIISKEALYCKPTAHSEPRFLFTSIKEVTHWMPLPQPPTK